MNKAGLPQLLVVTLMAGALGACGESDPAPASSGASSGTSGGASGTSGGASGTSGGSSGTSGGAPDDASTTRGLPASCANGDEGGVVPATPAELNAWLQRRAYTCWARESAVHPSAGPHGGNVKTFLNAALDSSMKGAGEHPAGAVAVKELYSSGTVSYTHLCKREHPARWLLHDGLLSANGRRCGPYPVPRR